MNFNWRDGYSRYRRYFVNIGRITRKVPIQSLAWLSLSLITVTFFALAAIKPTLTTIAQLTREIKDKREASQKLQQKINAIVAAQKVYAKNVDLLPLLDEALPEKNEFPRLAFFLEELASSSGVELKSLDFEKITTKQKSTTTNDKPLASSLRISLGVAGDFLKLKDFLNGLESSRRVLKMELVSFSQVKKGEIGELSLQFVGRASFGKGPQSK